MLSELLFSFIVDSCKIYDQQFAKIALDLPYCLLWKEKANNSSLLLEGLSPMR